MLIKNMWLHFKKICIHKYYVGKYCWKLGLYKQGILHDITKFSPIEFFESAKYYQGDRSPIDACKEVKGYSDAWLHHKGRNPHHYEYWQDDFDNGGKPLIIPYKYSAEMLCDYLGAGHAYWGKDFTYKSEEEWWESKTKKHLAMHPINKRFISLCLSNLAIQGDLFLTKETVKFAYDEAVSNWTGMEDIFW